MKGKLIDTWIYEYEGVAVGETSVSAIKVPVRLFIQKEFKDSEKPPLATKSVSFELRCDKPEFIFTGSDIECLRVAMWEALSDHFKVKWESYYVVEIRPEHGYGEGIGTGMVFEYRSVEKGTAWDGTLLMKERRYHKTQIDPWPGDFKAKDGKTCACIPATKANRESLESFGKRIDALREMLAEFLRPHRIMDTLADVSRVKLLAEPDEVPHQA